MNTPTSLHSGGGTSLKDSCQNSGGDGEQISRLSFNAGQNGKELYKTLGDIVLHG